MPGVDAVYIFSKTLRSIPDLGRSLFAAGVIDEVGVNAHPILLGSGVPLFLDTGRRISLDLIENRTIDGGCVLATYRVRH